MFGRIEAETSVGGGGSYDVIMPHSRTRIHSMEGFMLSRHAEEYGD